MASDTETPQPAWMTALTVLQEVMPPFIPEGAHAMTQLVEIVSTIHPQRPD